MKLRADARWSLVVPTSMGLRITPENRQPVHTADRFVLQATSAETNVAAVVSHLGEPTKVLTAFVAGSPMAAIIKANLRARNMSYEGPELPQGDAWGFRHQFNIADSGYGGRAPRV
ncbi:MAG TPA: sugar kinase, partial [Propionicimonas sp.]